MVDIDEYVMVRPFPVKIGRLLFPFTLAIKVSARELQTYE